ncbi:MAG TPA: penicillin-binding transpeptidase domain-containing protein, partial [Egibacteraceae bacterium]|nr:penicillin-binding transpeptidase domain-containing protein [Egibacteraceae bacterium]
MQSGTSADPGEAARLRLVFFGFLVASLMLLLVVRLWFLQVMSGDRYAQAAEGNAVRTISVEAPRGQIFDRDGALLVDNRYAMVVSVQPAEMGDRADEIIAELAALLALSPAEIHERIARSRVSAFRPKPIAADVPVDVAFYIHENAGTRFPGVYAETLPVRTYPQGTTAAHVLGYLGEIGGQELTSEAYDGYQPGDLIGWSGVERSYEQELHGQRGLRRFQVDARGDVTGELDEIAPTPGADLKLALDLEAQRLTEDALLAGIDRARRVYDRDTGPGRGGTFRAPAGAAVVLDPNNGEVRALASFPTFEPEQFVGGVGRSYWSWLQDRGSSFPLINRAIQSSHPPGSVFKVVSAAAALHEGFMTPTSQLPCPARWEWAGTVYRNWKSSDSGALNLVQALEQSCDTVFYELARGMWTQEQQEGAAGQGGGGGTAPGGQVAAAAGAPTAGPSARERLSD